MRLEELVVVVVEGSAMQQKIVAGELRAQGVRDLRLARSGAAALALLEDSPVDLLVSAMYLDDMTGTELLHAIRGDERYRETAFILISSETGAEALDPIRQAGAIAILSKQHFDAAALRSALRATLQYYDSSDELIAGREPEDLEVLVVDDSAMSRKHIRRLLDNLGIEHIDEAADGATACELLAQRFYDVALTDYNMPGMDGRELVEYIRGSSPQPSLPVLMITSEHDSRRLAAVELAGVSAICDKPFDPARVRGLLDVVLRDE